MGLNPHSTDWIRPPRAGFAITPGSEPLEAPIRGINLATDGVVRFRHEDGSETEPYLVAGVIHPAGATHVLSATATGLWGYT